MRNRKIWVVGVIAVLLLCLGLGAYQYFKPEKIVERAESESINIVRDKEIVKKPTEDQRSEKKVSYNTVEEIPSFSDLLDMRKSSEGNLLRRGHLVIPALKISVPIYEGTSEGSLSWGSGTAKANQVMGEGNYAVAAHNYKKLKQANNWFFSNFQNEVAPKNELDGKYIKIKNGENIYATDGENVFEYRVIRREIVPESKVEVLEDKRVESISKNKKPLLTMTTCYEEVGVKSTYRIVVVAEQTKKVTLKEFKSNQKIFDEVL